MSGYLGGLVWLVGPTERVERFVLLAIADAADDKTGYCYPSVRNLANKALFSERAVKDAIQQLENGQWMTVQHRAIDGRYNAYTVNIERLELLRQLQREQEKSNKQSSLKATFESYVADLLQLHSQVKSLHLSSNDAGKFSGEKSSPQHHNSGANSSPHSSAAIAPHSNSGEIGSTSEVKSTTFSGEIHDIPNKKKHQQTSLKQEALNDDEFPEGLHVTNYRAGIVERCHIVGRFALNEAIENAIKALARMTTLPLHRAAELLERRITSAQSRGEAITVYWFEQDNWKHDGATNGTNQPGGTQPSATATRVAANVAAINAAVVRRGIQRSSRTGDTDGASVSVSRSDGRLGGIPNGLRKVGSADITSGGVRRAGGTAH